MSRTSAIAQALVVWRKELVDSSRDRRSLYSLAFGALFGPILLGFILNRVVDRQRESEEIRLPVVGIEHAPALVDWLRQQSGIEVVAGPADPEKAVRDQDYDVVIVIEDDFAKRFRASRPAPVKVVSDDSRQSARPKVQRVRTLLQRYSAEIGSLRLVGRGVSPSIATAIRDRKRGGLERPAARRDGTQLHPAVRRSGRVHGRHADRDGLHRRRARTRVARAAARQPCAAPGDRRRASGWRQRSRP